MMMLFSTVVGVIIGSYLAQLAIEQRWTGHDVLCAGEMALGEVKMSSERAKQLIQELEFMQMEIGLNENDTVLLKELRHIRREYSG